MKEYTPWCPKHSENVCLLTGSWGALVGATKAAQDPSSQADDVLRVGEGYICVCRGVGGYRCFLSAHWKITKGYKIGNANQ